MGKVSTLRILAFWVSFCKLFCIISASCQILNSDSGQHFGTENIPLLIKMENYCWWLKSCTSLQVVYPVIYRVSYIPGGARFQPSTVGPFCCTPSFNYFEPKYCELQIRHCRRFWSVFPFRTWIQIIAMWRSQLMEKWPNAVAIKNRTDETSWNFMMVWISIKRRSGCINHKYFTPTLVSLK